MLSIQATETKKCTPNLLPARIHHNGPVDNAQRYWKPETDEKGNRHAYLRGRHLHGASLPLPKNYTGAVLLVTDESLPQSEANPPDAHQSHEELQDGTDEQDTHVKVVQQLAEFDEILIWGHGGQIDDTQDRYARGMNEWLTFSESIHVEEDEAAASSKKDS